MRKLFFLVAISGLLFASCSKDDDNQPIANFKVTVTGEAPNAELKITNNSTDAYSNMWTFSEGAGISESMEPNPGTIKVDKAGDITVNLTVKNSEGESGLSKTVKVSGKNAIVEYKDVRLP